MQYIIFAWFYLNGVIQNGNVVKLDYDSTVKFYLNCTKLVDFESRSVWQYVQEIVQFVVGVIISFLNFYPNVCHFVRIFSIFQKSDFVRYSQIYCYDYTQVFDVNKEKLLIWLPWSFQKLGTILEFKKL
jgi:hypothetical protein